MAKPGATCKRKLRAARSINLSGTRFGYGRHEGVLELAARLERRQDSTDLLVEEFDASVIVAQVLAHRVRGPGPGTKFLVANLHLAVVEWVPWHEV